MHLDLCKLSGHVTTETWQKTQKISQNDKQRKNEIIPN